MPQTRGEKISVREQTTWQQTEGRGREISTPAVHVKRKGMPRVHSTLIIISYASFGVFVVWWVKGTINILD